MILCRTHHSLTYAIGVCGIYAADMCDISSYKYTLRTYHIDIFYNDDDDRLPTFAVTRPARLSSARFGFETTLPPPTPTCRPRAAHSP